MSIMMCGEKREKTREEKSKNLKVERRKTRKGEKEERESPPPLQNFALTNSAACSSLSGWWCVRLLWTQQKSQ